MGCSLQLYRMSIGVFVWTLIKILSKKALKASNRVKGLRVHSFSAKLAISTLLLMLLMAGVEPNPGPSSVDRERNSTKHDDDDCARHDNGGSHIQQQFDRVFSAINDFSRTVSNMTSKISDLEQMHKETRTHLDKRLDDMKRFVHSKFTQGSYRFLVAKFRAFLGP